MTNPKLALIPSGYKATKVYSILPSDGGGDFTFDRANGYASRVREDGLIEEVSNDTPRLDYLDGGCPSLLLEPSRTNLITYSENFSQWTNTRSSDLSGFISPTGENNATKFISDTTASSSHIIKSSNFTISSGQTYTYSVFVKANQLNYVRLLFTDSTLSKFLSVYFNLTNGTVGTTFDGSSATLDSSNIENFGNGWFRCSVTGDLDTTTTAHARIYLSEADNDFTFDGDGTSSIYIYGAQLEQGSYATSYIKSNSGSPTTRFAETCTDAGDATIFNDEEGVLYAEISALHDSGHHFISVNNSNVSNRITIELYPNTGTLVSRLTTNGVQKAFLVANNIVKTNMNKIAVRYYLNNFSLWVNGNEISDDLTDVPVPIGLNSLDFKQGNNSGYFYGKCKDLRYYDTALTDAELTELTT